SLENIGRSALMLKALGTTAFVLSALTVSAAAQDWPSRNITLVVPFAAGGGIDTTARVQALALNEILGQAVGGAKLGPAGRRRRNGRQRRGRKGRARRIPAADRQFRHACLHPIAVREEAV